MEPGEPTTPLQGVGTLTNSVWYEWTAPSNGIFYYSYVSAPGVLYSLNIYLGTMVSALTPATAEFDGGIPVAQGQALEIQVASIVDRRGDYYPGPFTLNLSELIPATLSTNDMFTNAAEITVPYYSITGGIYGATIEAGEPLPDPSITGTLWWHVNPASDGLLCLALTTSADFAPFLTVYAGSNFATLSPTGGMDALASEAYPVEAGLDYYVQLGADDVTYGQYSLTAQFNSQSLMPTNDMFDDSAQVFGTNIVFYGNFAAATSEPDEPPSQASNTVWVAWVPPFTGRAYYYMNPTGQPQYVNVYTGPSLTLLQSVRISTAFAVRSFLAVQDTVYYFQFSGGNDTFLWSLSLSPLDLAANDNFTNAFTAAGNNVFFGPASIMGATTEPGEPDHMGSTPDKSIWWNWQAPEFGYFTLTDVGSLATNHVFAVYTGNSVGTLTLVAKGSNNVTFPTSSGQLFRIAGAVPTNAIGDLYFYGYLSPDTSVHLVPGNVLQEPSWEGTGILGAQYWHSSGSLGGYVDESTGDCDGTTWPELDGGVSIWQNFSTVPGHSYSISFGFKVGGNLSQGSGDAYVEVLWDTNELGIADLPGQNSGFWNWRSFSATASNTNSMITFSNLARNVEMDYFSVVDQTAAPSIMSQPSPLSTESGGSATFTVNAAGTLPLTYQWYSESGPLTGQTNLSLLISVATTNQSGNYFVVISNSFGMVTSTVVSLTVDAPSYPTIVVQPYGQTVASGGYFCEGTVVVGTQPISYQWTFDGAPIPGATNATLTITNAIASDVGTYQLIATNTAGTVYSLPATLSVSQSQAGGGTVVFANYFVDGLSEINAPVYDVDGVTPLNGGYVAQLYAGPSLALLRPAGAPVSFGTGFDAGFWPQTLVTLPTVTPGSIAFVQVRAWDPSVGATFEMARAIGGKFGESEILQIPVGGGLLVPTSLTGLQSFTMQAGLPEFNVGIISFVGETNGIATWSLAGDANSIYVIEEASNNWVWFPYTVLTNLTGTVTFTNTVGTNNGPTFFRSRILN